MPFLSIIIPTKNEERYLPALLNSLKEQSFQDFEVIVADHASTDRTREIAGAENARMIEGGMPGVGRNRGAEVASGEIFLFLDADVVLPSPFFLDTCLKELNARQADVACCRLKPLSPRVIDHALYAFYHHYVSRMQWLQTHAQGSCMFVRQAVHQHLMGFDERVVLAEDSEYAERAVRFGYTFATLRAFPVHVSVRRLEAYGRASFTWKYIFMELHLLVKGPIRAFPFEYEMGGGGLKSTQSVWER